ncbi:hypothetical protein ACLSZ5_06035 [Avibacterium avium]|uniref:hypothetical protein n=1 Tax=Avibacterium avium TaxID=751 RepID=UPI003BF925D9
MNNKQAQANGIIRQQRFLGAYYKYQVEMAGQSLNVISQHEFPLHSAVQIDLKNGVTPLLFSEMVGE